MRQVREHMAGVEQATGKGFGDPDNPLLVSVRSGSGAVDAGDDGYDTEPRSQCQHAAGEIRQTGDARFGYDAFRRFVQLFGKVAMGVPDELFDSRVRGGQTGGERQRRRRSVGRQSETDQRTFPARVPGAHRPALPEDPYEQLEIAIKAVFRLVVGQACGRLPA